MYGFNFTDQINELISIGARQRLTDEEFIVNEIQRFLMSRRRKDMMDGVKYYGGQHDILHRKRQVIGAGGKLEEVGNLPNNRLVDNQYKKMVNQKANYLLGQPIAVQSKNKEYAEAIKQLLDKKFLRLMRCVGRDSLNCGIGWLFVYYGDDGGIKLKRIKPYEVIAGWKDEDHTELDYAIRIFEVTAYEGKTEKTLSKVEVYDEKGVHRFVLDGGRLVGDAGPHAGAKAHEPYFTVYGDAGAEPFNWLKIPLIPFKLNTDEIPLINNVKSLQDGLNLIISNFQNNMDEDPRNTILVLVNYDGENLAEFRKNLSVYGAVKVRTIDGAPGDLKTLQVEVNAENYRTIIELFKKAIIENAMGYDAKDDRLGANANQMNIMSMYSDIDLDANEMETEYQASFEELLYFVNLHLANTGAGDFEGEEAEVIFNRDMLISESDIISNIRDSAGILSDETLVAQHPWVDDPQAEMDRKGQEAGRGGDLYGGAFPAEGGGWPGGGQTAADGQPPGA